MARCKDMQDLLKQCQEAGCTVEKRKGGHTVIILPSGRKVFCASTPGAWCRAVENTRAWLRREGVDV